MPDKWVVEPDYPGGHLVPMSDDESAALEHHRAAHQVVADAEREAEESAAARIADLRRARIELATGAIFPSFTPAERTVLDLLLAESVLMTTRTRAVSASEAW